MLSRQLGDAARLFGRIRCCSHLNLRQVNLKRVTKLCHHRAMPELVEVEIYRRTAERTLGRTIASVDANDAWFLKEGTTAVALSEALIGDSFTATRRIGKLLMLDISDNATTSNHDHHVLGLRFGMTGRLVVDGVAGIDELLYSSHRPDPTFVRFGVTFEDGGTMQLADPRRLGGVTLDPSTHALGTDAATISRSQLVSALAIGSAPLKARLLDQQRVAGIGNLIADEVLWRAKLSPERPAPSLSAGEVTRLHKTLISTISELQHRGGSHLGDLMAGRSPGAPCPRCGKPLARSTVGGRTSYWCPAEQG
jgi:formamidopyrimidine-DNA glycosylase